MALVTKIEHIDRDIRKVHDKTPCSYDIYRARDGCKYIQLVTYGSEDRQMVGDVSQTIQFDEEAAAQLKAIIEKTYPNLANSMTGS